MKDKSYEYSFSDEKHSPGGIILLSETPVALDFRSPIKLERPPGAVLYLDFFPRQPHASFTRGAITYEEDPDLMNVIQRLVKGGDPGSDEALEWLLGSSRAVIDRALGIIAPITNTIEKTFSDAGVSLQGAYDATDVKKVSGKNSIPDLAKLLDQNTKAFIKGHRIFAGLAFLRDQTRRLAYGIGFNKFTKHDGDQHKKRIEVVFYPSDLNWRYKAGSHIDRSGILVNKIIECLLLLIMNLNSSAPLVDFYRELNEKVSFGLKSDVLIRLVEALLQHNEVRLLDPALKQLRALEPHHPAIETAERAIRRAKVFAEIGGVNAGAANIQDLSGLEFERFLADRFRQYGFTVNLTKSSGDYGADIIVEAPSGTRAAVQAKRFKSKVNLKAVQEVVTSIPHYGADFGIVIAASGFFPSAVELARTNQVELWDDDKLYRFLGGDWSFSMLTER
jgi:restriction system protein